MSTLYLVPHLHLGDIFWVWVPLQFSALAFGIACEVEITDGVDQGESEAKDEHLEEFGSGSKDQSTRSKIKIRVSRIRISISIKDQGSKYKIKDRRSRIRIVQSKRIRIRIKDQRSRIKDQRQGHLEKSWPFEVSSTSHRLFIHCAVADFPRFFISFKLCHCFQC